MLWRLHVYTQREETLQGQFSWQLLYVFPSGCLGEFGFFVRLHTNVLSVATPGQIAETQFILVILRKPRIVITPTLSSLVAPAVVMTTTSGATSDDKFDIMPTRGFCCWKHLRNGKRDNDSTFNVLECLDSLTDWCKNLLREHFFYDISLNHWVMGPSGGP